mmetsp:Transcript_179/g.668  ORF Transcript_179/g.668 Transcript_179/m.668 type:complete len:403 (-) Transcript_179:555-1763(-)
MSDDDTWDADDDVPVAKEDTQEEQEDPLERGRNPMGFRKVPETVRDEYTPAELEGIEPFFDFYLQRRASTKEKGAHAIGYATASQRRALREAAKAKGLAFARIPGGGFRVGSGQIVAADPGKVEPCYGKLRDVFEATPVSLERTLFAEGRRILDPLPLGDYRSPLFRPQRRVVLWDANQSVLPEEHLEAVMAIADEEADGDATHLAAINPRANQRTAWGRRMQRVIADPWTTHPSTIIRVSSKKGALVDLLSEAIILKLRTGAGGVVQTTTPPVSRVVVFSRNKRLVEAIAAVCPPSATLSVGTTTTSRTRTTTTRKTTTRTTTTTTTAAPSKATSPNTPPPTPPPSLAPPPPPAQFRPAKEVIDSIARRPTASVTKAKRLKIMSSLSSSHRDDDPPPRRGR